jgi:hypothetical protein
MKPTALALTIAACAFGASTLYLSMQLHDERLQSDKLAAETRALNARIAELEKVRADRRFTAVNPFAARPSRDPPKGHAGDDNPAAAIENAVERVAISPPHHNDAFLNKMMRSQVRAHHKKLYADVGTLLGLSKDEAGKLIDLLTDQQLEAMNPLDGASTQQDLLSRMEEKRRQDQAQIAELIGADNAQKLEDFQRSLPARQELDMLARQLDGADTPLSDDQQKRLLTLITEELKRTPAPTMSDTGSLQDFSRAYMTWQEDYEANVAAQVRNVLNSDQLATFDEYQSWQRQMRSQMGVVHAGSDMMFTTAAPAVSMDIAVAPPPARETPRK